ncbi:hypothetical protein MRY82_08060 [bacterium]|nr:hypothetical protein [bacterium]
MNLANKSEDSFLRHFCEIKPSECSSIYYWKDGVQWPKFTFIRVHVAEKYDEKDFESDSVFFIDKLKLSKREIYIKVSDDLEKSSYIKENFKLSGSRLAYFSFKKNNGACSLEKDEKFVECKNERDLENFWLINSSGRSRKDPFLSPLWPIIKNSFLKGTRYFVLEKNNIPVSGAALDIFEGGYNLWGLATVESAKRKGFMKKCIYNIMQICKGDFYAQTNYDSITHQYFLKHHEAEFLGSETWYVHK